MMSRFVASAFVIVGLVSLAQADWPQFRGPTGQGHSDAKKLPVQWGPDKNVAWKTPVPGHGWSSPVIAKGRVYLTTAVPKDESKKADHSLRALCYDVNTGKNLWDVEVFKQDGGSKAPTIHSKNSHASATATVVGDRLFVHFGHQGTACLNTNDGSKIWDNRSLSYTPVHGNGGSIVPHGNKLYICIDGIGRREVVAFDASSGKVVWSTPRTKEAKKPFSFCTPLIITVNGKEMLVAPGSDVVTAHDLDTGKELWSLTFSGYSIVPRPVFSNGMLFMSTGYDNPSLLAIKIESQGTTLSAKIEWKMEKTAPRNASPLLVGNELYTVSDTGFATCMDAKTGKVHWSQQIPGAYSASPIFAAGNIYIPNEQGIVTIIKPGKEFDEVEQNKFDERTFASFAVEGNSLVVRTEKHLYRITEK